MKDIDYLFEKDCYVIDFLPFRVAKENKGDFFAIEGYYLDKDLRGRFLDVILKLNCYYSIEVNNDEYVEIQDLAERILSNEEYFNIYIEEKDCLLTLDTDDSHMSVYNPDEEILKLLDKLASGSGLYLWRSYEEETAD
ncbi:MAG: hypothetical protein IKD94_05775 [Erysipelotrichaceae bacterium]|nr:hypothetical protein [Erysipelotrichaceae bacterium]